VFGSRDDALHARVQELEGRVERLSGLLGALLDDGDRPGRPAERADGARQAWSGSAGSGEPRFQAALDTVYHARTYGYVAVYFVGGRTARMRLLVGAQSPPTTSIGSTSSDYIGGIVRPGEYWMAATHKPGLKAGFECVFTPIS
jgi:hypothetical protein